MGKKKKSRDELCDEHRSKEVILIVSQQAVIEFAYTIGRVVERFAASHDKLFVEEANCFRSVFYWMRDILKKVDPEYLKLHPRIKNFYLKKRELSNNNDRLWWEKAAKEEPAGDSEADLPF
jgi:hypothetical protein